MNRIGVRISMTEFLVVLALVCAVLAVLAPTLETARQRTANVTCLGNLRQIGQAMLMYTQDNDSYLPAAYTEYNDGSSGFRTWPWLLEPYLHAGVTYTYVPENDLTSVKDLKQSWANTGDSLWHCPDDHIGQNMSYGANPMVTGSFVMMFRTMRSNQWEPSWRLSAIHHPELVIFAGDTNKLWSDDTQEYREVYIDWERPIDPPLSGKPESAQIAWYRQFLKQDYTYVEDGCPTPGLYGCKGPSYRHNRTGPGSGSANMVFCDGHVKSFEIGTITPDNLFPNL